MQCTMVWDRLQHLGLHEPGDHWPIGDVCPWQHQFREGGDWQRDGTPTPLQ
jgi:hypothetical protein